MQQEETKVYNIKSIGLKDGLELAFTRGWARDEKITVKGAELELSKEFDQSLGEVLSELPECLDLPSKFAPRVSQVKLPKAYLRPGDERQISMFPADLENHLIELKRQCNLVVEDYIKSFLNDISDIELRRVREAAGELGDSLVRGETKLSVISSRNTEGVAQ